MTETTDRLRQLLRDEPWDASATGVDSRVESLLAGELEPEAAESLAASLIDDPELAFQVRVASTLAEARRHEQANDAPVTHTERAPQRWPWAVGFAVAAALIMSFVVRPPTLDDTGDTGDSGMRAGSFPLLAPTKPSAALPRDAFLLEWTGGPAGAAYDLFVTTPTLEPVYQALEIPDHQHRIPASALAAYPSGTRLLWRIVAVTGKGRRIHSSAFEVVLR